MSNTATQINFNDTKKAFAYKSNQSLKKAKFLFSIMQFAPLVKLGTIITPWAIKSGLPIIGIIKKTLFQQFVGGETLEETVQVADMLNNFKVQVILDYGVEGGEGNEEKYEAETAYFLKVIQFAATKENIPFISIKITGLVNTSLLEKMNSIGRPIRDESHDVRFEKLIENLSAPEKSAWDQLRSRTERICSAAYESGIGIMIDAEESWIQDPIDVLANIMMKKFNTEKAVVYNTIQVYRSDRFAFLAHAIENARTKGYTTGVKLVRGAYMEKERARAEKFGYPSPIQPDKASTDKDYDAALTLCLKNIGIVSIIVASHNEDSNLLATTLSKELQIPTSHPNLHFSQLYGMSDNLTFNLSDVGYNVSKYLPFGPVNEVIPYLMRRAQENSSVSGQTGRELELIKKEHKRRNI